MPSSLFGVVCLLMAPPSGAASPDTVVIERVLAVVDRRPVLLSEVRLVERLRNVDQRAALDLLIDELLMYAEARRFAQALPSPTEEAAAMDSLAGLNAQGISQAERRRLAHRQATIMKYIAVRLRPLVRVSDETIRQALKQKQADHNEAEVRERLVQRELDLRVEEWAHRLREGASIDYPDPRDAPAP
jgi:hypothetical protein